MARTELEPLLSSSMFHYKKSSDSAHLLEASSGMATPNEDELVVSQMSYTSVDSESLRKRTSSSPPGSPTDDFIQIQVWPGVCTGRRRRMRGDRERKRERERGMRQNAAVIAVYVLAAARMF